VTIETIVVDGLSLAKEIRDDLSSKIAERNSRGLRPPCLAVVLVGDDPASASYIKGKRRACQRVGMESEEHKLDQTVSQTKLTELIEKLNNDPLIDGILIQLPLPPQINAEEVAASVEPLKDVDGLHPLNSGRLLAGQEGLFACTPLGIMEILSRHQVPIEGSHAVVLGRSSIVGKPISLLLQQKNATVTMCHSRTKDLSEMCRQADILVAAVGVPRLVKRDWIKPGAAVIDVGVTELEGNLVGDVDFEEAKGVASLLTPHRRGVGPMTITMLLVNTLRACEMRL
jgi:methylenetetrahydrofolate dehydrogenase (NADP+)/methenyltetrahydrofolate cyclohydrolase